MKRDTTNLGTFYRIRTDLDLGVRSKVLIVGEVRDWLRSGRSLPAGDDLAFLEFDDLTREIIESIAPSVVLAPLMSRRFDCLELAERLCAIGFRGRLRALADNLPNPAIVRNEVRARCPHLDFDVTNWREAA